MAKAQSTSHYAYTLLEDVFAVASTLLKRRKEQGVEQLHSMSEATRDYVASLPDIPNLRAKAGAAAESIDEIANYAKNTDVEQMVSDAATFARKHPLTVLGLTLAVGVVAAQLLRTTPVAVKMKPSRSSTKAKKKKTKPKIAAKPRRKTNGAAHANA